MFHTLSENDLMMMNEDDYKDHMLLKGFDDDEGAAAASLIDEDDVLSIDNNDDDGDEDTPFEIRSFCNSSRNNKNAIVEDNKGEYSSVTPIKPSAAVMSASGIPKRHDVLCGQSRNCANHSGNQRFQDILGVYTARYDATTKKDEKMALTKEIVSKVQEHGGRFLKKCNHTASGWVEITDVAARDKISHALRTKVSAWKKRQDEMTPNMDTDSVSSASTRRSISSSKRPTQRKKSSVAKQKRRRGQHSRRSSSISIATTSSLDTNHSAQSSSIMEELMRRQKAIFETLVAESESFNQPEGKDFVHPLKK